MQQVKFKRDFTYIPAEGAPARTIPGGTVGEVIRTLERHRCYYVQVRGEPVFVIAMFRDVDDLSPLSPAAQVAAIRF
jgi:hypothetical protein